MILENTYWEKQRVLVTGALGGIGSALISRLDKLGAQLITTDSFDSPTAERKLSALDLVGTKYLACDLNVAEQVTKFFNEINDEFPTSAVLLAGKVSSGNLVEQNTDAIHEVIDTNLSAQIIFARELIKVWIDKKVKGNLIFIGSWVGHVPWPSIIPYTASKAGLVAVARGIAREYATYGIRANIIEPGIVNTGMAAKQWNGELDYRNRATRAIPLGRLQEPNEVVDGIEFLLSAKSTYMTGSTLLIDGGASLYPLDPEEIN